MLLVLYVHTERQLLVKTLLSPFRPLFPPHRSNSLVRKRVFCGSPNTAQEKTASRKTTQERLRDGKLCERSQFGHSRTFYREGAPPRRSPPLSSPAPSSSSALLPVPSLWPEAYRYLLLCPRDLHLSLLYLYLSYSISRSHIFVVCANGHAGGTEKPSLSSLPILSAVHLISLALSLRP